MNKATAKALQDALDAIDYGGVLNRDLPKQVPPVKTIERSNGLNDEIRKELKAEAERLAADENYDKLVRRGKVPE